jgi:hypothetical protein
MPQRRTQSVALLSIQKLAVDVQDLADSYPVGHVRPDSCSLAEQALAAREMIERAEEIQKHAAILLEFTKG